MKKVISITILCIFILSGVQGFAQPHHPPGGLEEKTPRRQILMLMKLRMIEDLNMTEEQTNSFFPKFNEWEDERREFEKEKRILLGEMKEIVERLEASDEKNNEAQNQLNQKLAQYHEQKQAFFESQEKTEDELMAILTPIQQAQFLIFQETFHRELRDTVRKVREQQAMPGTQREQKY